MLAYLRHSAIISWPIVFWLIAFCLLSPSVSYAQGEDDAIRSRQIGESGALPRERNKIGVRPDGIDDDGRLPGAFGHSIRKGPEVRLVVGDQAVVSSADDTGNFVQSTGPKQDFDGVVKSPHRSLRCR